MKAQNKQEVIEEGRRFMQKGFYDAALSDFKRVMFFDSTQRLDTILLPLTASIQIIKQDYNAAINDYGLVVLAFNNPDSILKYRVLKTQCNILARNFGTAIIELDSLKRYSSKLGLKKYNFLRAVACFGNEDYDASQQSFLNMLPENDTVHKYQVMDLFYLIKRCAAHTYRGAIVMSYILPGSGQIILGNYADGIDAFLLTSGFAALTVSTSLAYSPIEGLLSTFQWWLRYYKGNVNHVKDQAEYKRFHHRAILYRQILQIVNP